MSFLSNPPTPTEEAIITNDGFFPDIEPLKLRAFARLDGTVTVDRLTYSILSAIASVNAELWQFKSSQQQLGISTLAAVPADQIAGVNVKVIHYLRAVYSAVQADLIEHYRDFDTTGAGDKAAEKLEQRTNDLRRNMRWAISDLLAIRRNTVELI
ncbi:head completion/stabilization protein [Polaromonas naphthalenivorans]|uniref:Phage head completion n=1 Tax=Polaromonas naphthalenivorans (strain CJ2) TaxID=365044 RepID=A1VSG3_POLNA|nr:head completion/stabilization protein [Polaromonas naphthalenivorans]ABM38591.1 phage head completion [Polaromonas naphthalenivorans CJ2]